jgi:4-hydroxybenzoate polyprenyltransferase
MQDVTITFTGGWAIFAIGCILYFIANIVYGFGLLIEKKIKDKKNKKA